MSNLDLFEQSALDKIRKSTMAKAKDGGCTCPVCGQYAKVYTRNIYGSAASQLIQLYILGGDKSYVHVNMMGNARDFQIAKHWGLIEPQPNDDKTKRTAGMWRLTSEGVGFLRRETDIPKFVFVYKNSVLGVSDDRVTIDDCLGKKFNYEELMNG